MSVLVRSLAFDFLRSIRLVSTGVFFRAHREYHEGNRPIYERECVFGFVQLGRKDFFWRSYDSPVSFSIINSEDIS